MEKGNQQNNLHKKYIFWQCLSITAKQLMIRFICNWDTRTPPPSSSISATRWLEKGRGGGGYAAVVVHILYIRSLWWWLKRVLNQPDKTYLSHVSAKYKITSFLKSPVREYIGWGGGGGEVFPEKNFIQKKFFAN